MKNTWNCEVRLNFFTETCLMNNYFSHDPHFVTLAWVQNWNIFEKLMKLWSLPEFFHKIMSHEQLLFTWSTFPDSIMGAKLKYFWKTRESVQSARIFSQKYVSRTITFHVIHISWFEHQCKVEIFLKYSWKCVARLNFFAKNMSHERLLFTWSTFRDSSIGAKLKYFWNTHDSV